MSDSKQASPNEEMMKFIHQHIVTPVGTLKAKWSDEGLFSCEFLQDSDVRIEMEASGPDGLGDRLAQSLTHYFECREMNWDLGDLDWQGTSAFQQNVLMECYKIPLGKVFTYGQLAAASGHPKAARAVGGVMARNRWPILIPCHRVVGGNGRLTGYSGRGGLSTKRILLDFESARTTAQQELFP